MADGSDPMSNRRALAADSILEALVTRDWSDIGRKLSNYLTESERLRLATALLVESEPCNVLTLFDGVLSKIGPPMPHLLPSIVEDAQWWAGLATSAEKKTYFAKIFEAMSENEQAAATRWIEGRKNG